MPRYSKWYETDARETVSRTYKTREDAEKERPLAREWGWESSPARIQRKGNSKNSQPVQEYVVTYTRTSAAAAAAAIKRHWEGATDSSARLSSADQQVTVTLAALHVALEAARSGETNPITLESQVRAATKNVITAYTTLRRERQDVAHHYRAAHDLHHNIPSMTPLIRQMHIPTLDEVDAALEEHGGHDEDDSQRAIVLPRALSTQDGVVTAVRVWQEAVAKRWRIQRAYLPVERQWERILVRTKAISRRTPAAAVSRDAVMTQVLHATEVAPNDSEWQEAEKGVQTTETSLLKAIATRDAAMVAVAGAFGIAL